MGDSDTTDGSYAFGSGIGEDEVARLEVGGRVFAPATRMILAEAGIRPGMRVLDLGCGAGDSTFVAADLVGPGGSVVDVDHAPDALARARYRAGQRGLTQVQFIEGDIHDPAPGGPFGAIIERLALWLDPDPAHVLRQQAAVLCPGGLVVPIEPDLSPIYQEPEMPLLAQWKSWMFEVAARTGQATTGRRLWAIAEEAGLRPLGMTGVQLYFGPGGETGVAYFLENMRVAEPLLVGTGAATTEEIGMETWEQRLRDEWERTRAVAGSPMLLSAWATTLPQ
jgi:SAM-dependent methyltransferase